MYAYEYSNVIICMPRHYTYTFRRIVVYVASYTVDGVDGRQNLCPQMKTES